MTQAAGPDDATAGLRLDPGSPVPVGEQLQRQVVDLVVGGVLPAGHPMPTVRALAVRLGVAPNTVAKVYRALEQDGLLVTAGRHGTRVADQHAEASARTRQELRAVLQPLLDDGMSRGEVLALVRSVLGD